MLDDAWAVSGGMNYRNLQIWNLARELTGL